MAQIRHVAIVVSDQERAADFYKNTIGLSEAGREYTEHGSGVYLCDGEINLALLNYQSDAMAGAKNSSQMIGTHHFGIQVEALDVRDEADGLHHLVGLDFGGLAVLAHGDGDGLTVVVDRFHLGAGHDLHAELLELLLDLLGDLGVLVGQRARQELAAKCAELDRYKAVLQQNAHNIATLAE